jgi:hypothetical protein
MLLATATFSAGEGLSCTNRLEVMLHLTPDGLSCSIPDDHIDPRRSALFMARSVLRDIQTGGTNACSTS